MVTRSRNPLHRTPIYANLTPPWPPLTTLQIRQNPPFHQAAIPTPITSINNPGSQKYLFHPTDLKSFHVIAWIHGEKLVTFQQKLFKIFANFLFKTTLFWKWCCLLQKTICRHSFAKVVCSHSPGCVSSILAMISESLPQRAKQKC